jgi:quinoprotein dehydrogenase-associated probable ABC transporter substrate-binding protein
MFSRCLSFAILASFPAIAAESRVLRVCADPNNLPYSNSRGEGFENRLAEMIAKDLGARLEYTWWAERKSFLKHSLNAGKCDAVMGVPAAVESVETTNPYYRSTYVFVSRKDRALHISSLSDPRLADWKIGIHVVDDDYAPPAHALARRGLSANLAGYSLFGKKGEENPPARLVEAVEHGIVDVAIIWGPFAGYFGKNASTPLEITPVSPSMYLAVPFTYDMSAAVRKGDDALRDKLNRALERECAAIKMLLNEYGVPLIGRGEKGECESSQQASSASWR